MSHKHPHHENQPADIDHPAADIVPIDSARKPPAGSDQSQPSTPPSTEAPATPQFNTYSKGAFIALNAHQQKDMAQAHKAVIDAKCAHSDAVIAGQAAVQRIDITMNSAHAKIRELAAIHKIDLTDGKWLFDVESDPMGFRKLEDAPPPDKA